jgi:hypothetical protein
MIDQQWFSTTVRLLCLLESGGGTGYRDSVFLIRGKDFEDAFRRALEVGRAQERTYVNGDDVRVRWIFTSVVSLDALGRELTDGTEIYSEPLDLEIGSGIGFETRFFPEESTPVQTV